MSAGRLPAVPVLVAAAVLLAGSIGLQVRRDRAFRTDRPAEQVLYVQSPEVVRRLALSYDAIVADIYYIRALQVFGAAQKKTRQAQDYELLYPLLDMATGLDPQFNMAYRFGAIFLTEPKPAGPGRPDLAEKLLLKGLKANPKKWEYVQDIGFAHFWGNRDYRTAASWFEKASEMPGAAWFLKPLAATTLAQGGQRSAARMLFQAIAESGEIEWTRKDAQRRLRQLDAMDAMDTLRRVAAAHRARSGPGPVTWEGLVRAGSLRGIPADPDGFIFVLDPWTGDVRMAPDSTLLPLPDEPPPEHAPVPVS